MIFFYRKIKFINMYLVTLMKQSGRSVIDKIYCKFAEIIIQNEYSLRKQKNKPNLWQMKCLLNQIA